MKLSNVIVLLVVALVCAGVFFLIGGTGGPSGAALLPSVMPKFEKSDATVVKLKASDRELEVRKQPGSIDRWDVVVGGSELLRADPNAVDDLLAALSRQSVREKIPIDTISPEQLKEYGVEAPVVSIAITASGTQIDLRYGKRSREGANCYMDTGPGTDVWVVPKDATELAISGISSGLKSDRLFDATAFDVSRLEVVRGSVTTLQVDKDLSQMWQMSQPVRGYPNPKTFENLLSDIVNVKIDRWNEFSAPDLAKYGLDPPTYEVRITPRGEGRKTEVVYVGKDGADGAFALEQGSKTVVTVGRKFFDAVVADPNSYRDRSFTRLGRDAAAIEVRFGSVNYKLEKAGGTWDAIVGSERHPADRAAIERVLDRLATWQTLEFLDAQKPEDLGISEKHFVEITRDAVGAAPASKITLFFHPEKRDERSVYARRKDDGAAELVEYEPLGTLLAGAEQFFRKNLFKEMPIAAIDRIERGSGLGADGKSVQTATVERDLGGSAPKWGWAHDFTGATGTPDENMIRDILAALGGLTVVEWIPFAPEKDNARMGFSPPSAETLTIQVRLWNVVGLDPEPKIYVGRRREEGGGYYCRLGSKQDLGSNWAFILSDAVVAELRKAISKD